MSDGTVNTQVVDSVASVVTLLSGQAPSQAFGMLDAVMVETLGMAMHNAVTRQQAGGMVGAAAVTAACAKMLQSPLLIDPSPIPPPPPPPPPPSVNPLPGPPPEPPPPAAVIAAALAEGETAISVLKAQTLGGSSDASLAEAGLAQLAKDAASPPADPGTGGT